MYVRQLTLFAALCSSTVFAHADTITTFNIQGASIFYGMANDTNTVSGTVAVDTTTGLIQSISFNAAGLNYSGVQSQSGAEVFVNSGAGLSSAAFSFSQASLVGFSGSTFNLNGANDLFVGQLTASAIGNSAAAVSVADTTNVDAVLPTAIAVTPEPASLLLLSTGMLGMAALLRRRGQPDSL